MTKRALFTMTAASLCALSIAACTHKTLINTPQYWQRENASEAAYLNGPKAQQILNRDISRCVTELNELYRLGQIKDAIPVDSQGRVLDPDDLAMRRVDTPNRDGYLLSEYLDYQDFEGCMNFKGWERTEFVPYSGVMRAEQNYYENHIDTRSLRYKQGAEPAAYDPNAQTVDAGGDYND